jgi:SAM-dependent methyltransferase
MDYLDLHRKLDDAVRLTADLVAPMLMETLDKPVSVVDVGCGNGVWLAAFHRAGVQDFLGLDGDYIDRGSLQIPSERFHSVDLAKPFRTDRRFDLAVSLEVGEHLPAAAADDFVASVAALSDAVLFSAAVPGQGGVGHINEQWPSYWKTKFERLGYTAFDAVRPRIWLNPDVLYWYAQNILLFVRTVSVSRYSRLVTVPPVVLMDVVHPRRYATLDRSARAGDEPSLSHLMRSLPRAAGRFVKNAMGQPGETREPVHLPESKGSS